MLPFRKCPDSVPQTFSMTNKTMKTEKLKKNTQRLSLIFGSDLLYDLQLNSFIKYYIINCMFLFEIQLGKYIDNQSSYRKFLFTIKTVHSSVDFGDALLMVKHTHTHTHRKSPIQHWLDLVCSVHNLHQVNTINNLGWLFAMFEQSAFMCENARRPRIVDPH